MNQPSVTFIDVEFISKWISNRRKEKDILRNLCAGVGMRIWCWHLDNGNASLRILQGFFFAWQRDADMYVATCGGDAILQFHRWLHTFWRTYRHHIMKRGRSPSKSANPSSKGQWEEALTEDPHLCLWEWSGLVDWVSVCHCQWMMLRMFAHGRSRRRGEASDLQLHGFTAD